MENEDCIPCCDYCFNYAFNGEDGVYIGKGWCWKHFEQKDPEDECIDFICRVHGTNKIKTT